MTTHYTMTIDVQAWRVAADGSLPEDAMQIVDFEGGWRSAPGRDGREGRFSARFPKTIPGFRYWYWYDRKGQHTARPGDWIVQTPYGLEAMTDEQFRACCTEPDSDAEFVRKHPLFRMPFCNGSPLSIQRGDKIFDTDLAYVQAVGRGKYLEDRSHYNRPPTNPDIIERLRRGESCAGTCGACGRSTEVGDDE